jgi:hypothetical protein
MGNYLYDLHINFFMSTRGTTCAGSVRVPNGYDAWQAQTASQQRQMAAMNRTKSYTWSGKLPAVSTIELL